MNTISFTNDPQLAAQASMDPNVRVILVTENAPQYLIQNPNIAKLPILLPSFDIVCSYIDYGIDRFNELYYNYLMYNEDIMMNILLIGVALANKNILIYTTDEEWNRDSIPFMDILISVFSQSLSMLVDGNIPYNITLYQTAYTISDAVSRLFMSNSNYINEQSFVRYIKSLNTFRPEMVENYLRSSGIDLNNIPPELRMNAINRVISAKAENVSLMPALIGD